MNNDKTKPSLVTNHGLETAIIRIEDLLADKDRDLWYTRHYGQQHADGIEWIRDAEEYYSSLEDTLNRLKEKRGEEIA